MSWNIDKRFKSADSVRNAVSANKPEFQNIPQPIKDYILLSLGSCTAAVQVTGSGHLYNSLGDYEISTVKLEVRPIALNEEIEKGDV